MIKKRRRKPFCRNEPCCVGGRGLQAPLRRTKVVPGASAVAEGAQAMGCVLEFLSA
jgi:hypothetical protein